MAGFPDASPKFRSAWSGQGDVSRGEPAAAPGSADSFRKVCRGTLGLETAFPCVPFRSVDGITTTLGSYQAAGASQVGEWLRFSAEALLSERF